MELVYLIAGIMSLLMFVALMQINGNLATGVRLLKKIEERGRIDQG